MKKTILTCDRCKREVDHLYDGKASLQVHQLIAEWCLDCCRDIEPQEPSPTLEDMMREVVREIVREEIGEN